MTMIETEKTYDLTAGQIWQEFAADWHLVAEAAWEAGQDEISSFLEELALDAEEMCALFGWPLPSVN